MGELIHVGNLEGKHEQSARIYSEDGVCPTIMAGSRKTCTGGYISPKILINQNNKNKQNINKDKGDCGMNKKIKLFDSFSGVGALHSALKRLGVQVELVGISEVDPDAIINYAAIHTMNGKELFEKDKISILFIFSIPIFSFCLFNSTLYKLP